MQAELFASPAGWQRLSMEDAEVAFLEGFYTQDEARLYFQTLLEESAWRHEMLRLWGKEIAQPRLTAWYGDAGKEYRFSGLSLQPNPWTPLLLKMKQDILAATGDDFNSVLLNLYRNEQDSVAWHSDDEPELGTQPVIVSLSLGATRTFKLRHKTKGHKVSVDLPAGSLLRMAGGTQRYWTHAVLKEKVPMQARINLTFRQIRIRPVPSRI